MEKETPDSVRAVDRDSARVFVHTASKGPIVDKDTAAQAVGELYNLYRNMHVPRGDAKRVVQAMEERLNNGSSSDQARDAVCIYQAREGLIDAQESIIYRREP